MNIPSKMTLLSIYNVDLTKLQGVFTMYPMKCSLDHLSEVFPLIKVCERTRKIRTAVLLLKGPNSSCELFYTDRWPKLEFGVNLEPNRSIVILSFGVEIKSYCCRPKSYQQFCTRMQRTYFAF